MAFNNGFPVGYPQMNYQSGWNQSHTGQFRQQPQTNPQGGMNGWNPQNQFQPNQPQYQPQQQYQPQPFDNTVQSLQDAENYPVAPGVTVTLMDASGHTIYVKTADASGMAMPVRVFEEVNPQTEQIQSNYITRDEVRQMIADAMAEKKPAKKEAK